MLDRKTLSVLGGGSPAAAMQAAMGTRIVEGVIHSVTAEGAFVTFPQFDGGKHKFGPAPWPKSRVEVADLHDHAETTPTVGARCLVVFGASSPTHQGGGVSNPWIIGWW